MSSSGYNKYGYNKYSGSNKYHRIIFGRILDLWVKREDYFITFHIGIINDIITTLKL